MIAYNLLQNDDKETLIQRVISLDERLTGLGEENERLRKENEQLREKLKEPRDKEKKTYPDAKPRKRSKPPHEWGRKKGHPGCTRPKPVHIDREVHQYLERCPECNHKLSKSIGVDEHIQEDIVPSRVEATRFHRHEYWCRHCGKRVTAPYAADEVPCGYLGPRTLAMIVWLKHYTILPGNKIKAILRDFCGLHISEGTIPQALQRLARYLRVEAEVVLKAIQYAAYKQSDETGWNINGIGHWLWTVMNGQWAYFRIHQSRGSKVIKELLGNPFKGVLVSDFFSAYNRMQGIKQKCLVHLRREMRNAHGSDPPDSFLKPYKKLTRILDDAIRLATRRDALSTLMFRRRTRRIKERLIDFGCASYSDKTWQRLSKRLLKHEKELFTFLDNPGIPNHNNAAERAIRPHVIARNRSFQNRTNKGAYAHGILTSLLQTLALQKRDGMTSLASAYVKHRQGHQDPLLFQLPDRSSENIIH